MPTTDPRYPIGPFTPPDTITPDDRAEALRTLAELPEQMRNAVDGLSDQQLGTPYRDGGWTLRQVVHHVADSHTQAMARAKLALTEDWPVVTPFDQDGWAKLHDSAAPVEWSLEIIEAVHARLGMLLRSLTEDQWQRGFVHADRGRLSVERLALLYAWHSKHHLAHITHLRAARGW